MKKNQKQKSFLYSFVILFLMIIITATQPIGLSTTSFQLTLPSDILNLKQTINNQLLINQPQMNTGSAPTTPSPQPVSNIGGEVSNPPDSTPSDTNSTPDLIQESIDSGDQQLPAIAIQTAASIAEIPQYLTLDQINTEPVQQTVITDLPAIQNDSFIIPTSIPLIAQTPDTSSPNTSAISSISTGSDIQVPVPDQQKQQISTFISQKSNNAITKYQLLQIYQIPPQNSVRRFQVIYQNKLSYKIIYYLIILQLSSEQVLKIIQTGFRIYANQLTQQQIIQYIIKSNDKINLIPKYQIISNPDINLVNNFDTYIKNQQKIDLSGKQNVALFEGDQPYYRISYLIAQDQIVSFQLLYDSVFNKIKIISKKISALITEKISQDNTTTLVNDTNLPLQMVTEQLNNFSEIVKQIATDFIDVTLNTTETQAIQTLETITLPSNQPIVSQTTNQTIPLNQSTDLPINPENIDKQIYNLLAMVYSPDRLSKIKKATQTKVKEFTDGLYYYLNILAENNLQYSLVIYSKPQYNYAEIISYEETSSIPQEIKQYNLQQYETKIMTLFSTNTLNALQPILEYISENFSDSLNKSQIISIYQYIIPQITYQIYRLILKTQNYYELTFIKEGQDIKLTKKQKLFQGYHEIGYNPSQSQLKLSQSLINIAEHYMRQQYPDLIPTRYYNFDWDNILLKRQQFGSYYKVIITMPLSQTAVIFADSNGKLVFKNFQAVPTYYNDILPMTNQYKYLGILQDILSKYQTSKLSVQSPPNLQRAPQV